jgi:NADH:ubiquinone oxidoreductase subunit 5 (subunit L)/multisubunit Na+/H+ antiporter MnhA subunit
VLAFALGGVSLMGVLPSGPYLAKKLLLDAAAGTGQWWWAVVMQAGGFFTAGYMALVLAHAMLPADEPVRLRASVSRVREGAALALALTSLLLGLAPLGPVPRDLMSNPFAAGDLWSALVVVLGGGLLAIGLGRRLPRVAVVGGVRAVAGSARRAAGAVAGVLERADGVLREWPVAGLSLLALVIAFGITMVLGHPARRLLPDRDGALHRQRRALPAVHRGGEAAPTPRLVQDHESRRWRTG